MFILTDQWRAQATGYGGDPNVRTPHIDRLSEKSVSFQNAVSTLPVCTLYRSILMSGRYPFTTGMFLNDLYLPAEELCLAELYKKAGYDTGYIGKWHLDGHGRDQFTPPERRQGFDYWKALECTHNYNKSVYYSGDSPKKRLWLGYDAYAQTGDACRYIKKHATSGKPFILIVSYGAPHFTHHTALGNLKAKYPPESIKLSPNVPEKMKHCARKEAQGYYAHCEALDSCVKDLVAILDESGIADDTILAFTSDHGEMLGSQDQNPRQKQRPWDESIRVPFLLRYPPVTGEGGRVISRVLPTMVSVTWKSAGCRKNPTRATW